MYSAPRLVYIQVKTSRIKFVILLTQNKFTNKCVNFRVGKQAVYYCMQPPNQEFSQHILFLLIRKLHIYKRMQSNFTILKLVKILLNHAYAIILRYKIRCFDKTIKSKVCHKLWKKEDSFFSEFNFLKCHQNLCTQWDYHSAITEIYN